MRISKMKDCPFFWNRISERHIEDILDQYDNLREFIVCSAYMSEYGVEVLNKIVEKNALSKRKVKVYLSKEFSNRNCHRILNDLHKVSSVGIFSPKDNIMFHPKMILLRTEKDEVDYIIGSSNFTNGGLNKNVEMNILNRASEVEEKYLNQFLDMVEYKSKPVDEEIINRYEESEKEIELIQKLKKTIDRKYSNIFIDEVDPFKEDDYDLTNQFFKYEDYEVFFDRNQEQLEIEHRTIVKDKLLDLHEIVYERIGKLGMDIAPHWSKTHITSLITPQIFNHYTVEWMGVRYGKHQSELEKFWDVEGKNEYEGFQKHTCLQFSIGEDSFSVNLFHAVPYDAHDRHFLHEELMNSEFKTKLVSVLKSIEGSNSVWHIGDEFYDFSDGDAEGFIDFYKENDREGVHSFLSIRYDVNSNSISNENIVDTIIEDFEILYPIYKVVAKRY